MYGIATVGANGSLLTLVGTEPTVSGGNSGAPPNLGGVAINSALQPSDHRSAEPMPSVW